MGHNFLKQAFSDIDESLKQNNIRDFTERDKCQSLIQDSELDRLRAENALLRELVDAQWTQITDANKIIQYYATLLRRTE
jgi:hypothetical protein